MQGDYTSNKCSLALPRAWGMAAPSRQFPALLLTTCNINNMELDLCRMGAELDPLKDKHLKQAITSVYELGRALCATEHEIRARNALNEVRMAVYACTHNMGKTEVDLMWVTRQALDSLRELTDKEV